MKRYRLWTGLLILLIGIMTSGLTVLADVEKLSISQILQKGNDVYLYVSALDHAGNPASVSIGPEYFSVTIDKGDAFPVLEAAEFQSLNQGVSYVFCVDISKSVTEQEMGEIRSSISDFISRMSDKDYARIITIGSEIDTLCASTQDRNALETAVQSIQRSANDTYLYKGISYALDGQRKNVDTMPDRAAVILFTDGMDDSDGASSEEQVLVDLAETRIPVYVVGLKGTDADANLNSVGQIARQSGGDVFSYSDMSISQAVNAIGERMNHTCQLRMQPETELYGTQNLVWNVIYTDDGYSVSSTNYVYSLGLEGVTVPETEQQTEPVTEPPAPVTEPATETETETEEETSGIEKVTTFVQDNLGIVIACALILIALIILLVFFLRRRQEKEMIYDENDELLPTDGGDSTLADIGPGDEEGTVDESSYYDNDDDEGTVDGINTGGLRLEFEITFDGMTETVEKTLRDQLILGRGPECDVDVVLQSPAEERKQTSRKHAFIFDRPDGLYIKDNSKNKTYLNGVEVTGEVSLRDEDILQMGKSTVKIRILGY